MERAERMGKAVADADAKDAGGGVTTNEEEEWARTRRVGMRRDRWGQRGEPAERAWAGRCDFRGEGRGERARRAWAGYDEWRGGERRPGGGQNSEERVTIDLW